MNPAIVEALLAILGQVIPVVVTEVEKALNLPPPGQSPK